MVTKYFDRKANEITKAEFDKLNANEGYRIVNAFENEKARLTIVWTGAIPDADQMFRTTYPLFTAEQYDRVGDKWVQSPEFGRTFAKERNAASFYEDFVIRWTESYLDDDCNIVEVGNKIAKPKNLDAPQGTYDEIVW